MMANTDEERAGLLSEKDKEHADEVEEVSTHEDSHDAEAFLPHEHAHEVEAFLTRDEEPEVKRNVPFGLTPKSCLSVAVNIGSAVGLVSTRAHALIPALMGLVHAGLRQQARLRR